MGAQASRFDPLPRGISSARVRAQSRFQRRAGGVLSVVLAILASTHPHHEAQATSSTVARARRQVGTRSVQTGNTSPAPGRDWRATSAGPSDHGPASSWTSGIWNDRRVAARPALPGLKIERHASPLCRRLRPIPAGTCWKFLVMVSELMTATSPSCCAVNLRSRAAITASRLAW
jgi:hypothetical protein